MTTTPPGPARPATPPTAQPATRTVPPPPSIPPKPKALFNQLDTRLLRQAGTFTRRSGTCPRPSWAETALSERASGYAALEAGGSVPD